MKAAIYLGQENVEVRELPNPVCGDHDVVIKKFKVAITYTKSLRLPMMLYTTAINGVVPGRTEIPGTALGERHGCL